MLASGGFVTPHPDDIYLPTLRDSKIVSLGWETLLAVLSAGRAEVREAH